MSAQKATMRIAMTKSEWMRRPPVRVPGARLSPGSLGRSGVTDIVARLFDADGRQRLLACAHEFINLLLPFRPTDEALGRLPGRLQIVLKELAIHGLEQAVLERFDAILGRAFDHGEAAHGG